MPVWLTRLADGCQPQPLGQGGHVGEIGRIETFAFYRGGRPFRVPIG